jgi:mono/diheme cytochrome c family protein
MRRSSFIVLSFLLLTFHLACGDSSTKQDAGTSGTGGSTQPATGGAAGKGGAGGAATGGMAGSATGGTTQVSMGGAAGSSTGAGGSAKPDAASDAPMADAAVGDTSMGSQDASAGEAGLTGPAARGEYLVKNVLGCVNCHTPRLAGGGGLDNSKLLSGSECFSKDSDGGCLNSANLTNDSTGLKDLTDQQIKDAITKGIDPETGADGGMQYLFAQMPYYQFANLSADDADAIVAYLRTVPAVEHEAANTGSFATQPAAPEWAPVALQDFPAAAAVDGASAGTSNGRYLAALACATCHTVNTAAQSPLQLDVTKAFLGGKKYNTTIAGADGGSTTKQIQSSNLTPDSTALKDWTAAQIVTAIKSGKDEAGRTICSPMRPFPGMSTEDATDIANYLLGLPPVANPDITETCE